MTTPTHTPGMIQGIKRCLACQVILPIDRFGEHPRSRDRLQAVCRACQSARSREQWRRRRESAPAPSTPEEERSRWCAACNALKPLSAFGPRYKKGSGVQSYCRECNNSYKVRTRWRKGRSVSADTNDNLMAVALNLPPEEGAPSPSVEPSPTLRRCGLCLRERPEAAFSGDHGVKAHCIECRAEYARFVRARREDRMPTRRYRSFYPEEVSCTRPTLLLPPMEGPRRASRLGSALGAAIVGLTGAAGYVLWLALHGGR